MSYKNPEVCYFVTEAKEWWIGTTDGWKFKKFEGFYSKKIVMLFSKDLKRSILPHKCIFTCVYLYIYLSVLSLFSFSTSPSHLVNRERCLYSFPFLFYLVYKKYFSSHWFYFCFTFIVSSFILMVSKYNGWKK